MLVETVNTIQETNKINSSELALPRVVSHPGNSNGDGALRASEIRYRRLFECARHGILILDAATQKIIDANPFMTRLLGLPREGFVGKELWEIGLLRDKEDSQSAFLELQMNGHLRLEELPLQTTEGKPRAVEFFSNVYEEGGRYVIQCNIREITHRKRVDEENRLLFESAQLARSEADAANDIKDLFLATLSHELRTPLTSILGWSHLLNSGELDVAKSRAALEIIVRNAEAQRHLIDDLLDTSRIITGKLRLELRAVKLSPLIESVVDGLRPTAESRSINIQTRLDSPIGPISGDPDRLQQIIWNVLTNAIKFTPEGGTVQVRLERASSHIEISITDNGQGIEPEFMPHIFDRFRRFNSSNTGRNCGLGLGLSIVSHLVELHGGTVTADSPGKGRGSTFTVRLPATTIHHEPNGETSHAMRARSVPRNEQRALKGLRLLVVDDEADARVLVAAMLTAGGATVVSVGSANEALEEMKRQLFDVLVSDIGMSEMDGYDFINRVRQLPAECGGKIPAVALTAYAGIEDRKRALSAGYQIHISKPVEPAELTTLVASLAGQ